MIQIGTGPLQQINLENVHQLLPINLFLKRNISESQRSQVLVCVNLHSSPVIIFTLHAAKNVAILNQYGTAKCQ